MLSLDILSEVEIMFPRELVPRPQDMQEFDSLVSSAEFKKKSYAEREKYISEFYRRPDILDYINNKWSVEVDNRANFIRLNELKEGASLVEKGKINDKMMEFKKMIEREERPYPALRIDFSKYEIEPPKFSTFVEKAVSAVGGTVTEWEE